MAQESISDAKFEISWLHDALAEMPSGPEHAKYTKEVENAELKVKGWQRRIEQMSEYFGPWWDKQAQQLKTGNESGYPWWKTQLGRHYPHSR